MRYRLFQYSLPAPPELEDLNAKNQSCGAARGTTPPGTAARRIAPGTGRMTPTGTSVSGSVWFPVRRQLPPDDAFSSARCNRAETKEIPPRADICPRTKKARGGAIP